MSTYFKKLTGERIYLSPVDTADAEMFTKWLNDIEITRNLGMSHMQTTLSGEIKSLERLAQEQVYSIVTLEGDRLLGNCGLHGIDEVNCTAELGIFIGEKADHGKGYGTEAIRLLLDYGFHILNLNNIMLKLFSYNTAGYRCYCKCGFQEIGRRRNARRIGGQYYDEIYMDILAEEFGISAISALDSLK
jgi:RimJ/RimL family protein N-acetyltransferase